MDKGVDDSNIPLSDIAQRHDKPIVSLLLDIQKTPQQPQRKYLHFIRRLECLSVDESSKEELVRSVDSLKPRSWSQRITLIRREINAFEKKDYVALSYTWERSDHEDQSSGKYAVQTRDERQFFPSPVRDCVFDRVLSYMQAKDLDLLWIDRHCVKQKTCGKKGVCYHARCNQKHDAIQTMDLVYKLSKNPVALLGMPIEWRDELDLLVKVLTGQLVYKPPGTSNFQLSQTTSQDEASRALGLLSRITKDRWWTRAWTFQENYRAGAKMTLLIRHPPFLEAQKRSYGRFLDVPCEICIKSVDFCKTSTELCLAVQAQTPRQADASCHAEQVLAVVGKYTVLLDRSESMTPSVIAAIQRRSLGDAWDKPAIIANCCQYAIRMDNLELKRMSQSLSLSILAMCLLNGEILHNGVEEEDPTSMSDKTVSQYLEAQAFKGFCAPRSERDLTFNKGCRFVEVQLKQSGIKTRGHLWKLGRIIHTARFRLPLSGAEKSSCSLTPDRQGRLTQLVAELRLVGETSLATQIERFLNDDSTRSDEGFKSEAFPKRYMNIMAEELAAAIENGKSLRLGQIWGALEPEVPCSAIFVWDPSRTERNNGDKRRETNTRSKGDRGSQEAFVFTATSPMERGYQQHGTNDLDHHVSLEVSWPLSWRQAPNRLPRLYIKSWLLGLCFFYGFPKTDVIFPWPSALQAVDP
ncbi:HET domain-containing protein [Fusarium falciforme]|uniref:HET domain-containing protein n=1 Tax=Fusarium falciforme TaxID=195108 RepID=UPI002300105C|nr:HET domain-containing protein [Fusarium falciforme]WAO91523.1 HET domain-containing protein [Fusarium falciforme]